MTLYRATVMDTPRDPFVDGANQALVVESDAALVVLDGVITARGPYADVRAAHDHEEVVDLRGGVLLPGMVDTHVHYPQVRAIAGLGMPLLDWLSHCALPEEARLVDDAYAAAVAGEFLGALVDAGTTTALVFGAHYPSAMDLFFAEAQRSGLRITAGLVVSDRILRPDLLITPELALSEGNRLVKRWHGQGRLRYAVTPRFSLSTTDAMLDSCAELMGAADDLWFTSHLNENLAEVAEVAALFPEAGHYLGSYASHGLVTDRSVFAHNVHAADAELDLMASTGAWASHCPTSNAALGSGLFPLRRHYEHGARVALGCDVGAGTGFSMIKEGLQAYFMQQLLGGDGLPLAPAHLLYLCTRAGAQALGLDDRIGDLRVGKEFDAILLEPRIGSTLATVLPHAADAHDALAKIFALANPADIASVWVGGDLLSSSATTVEAQTASPSTPSSTCRGSLITEVAMPAGHCGLSSASALGVCRRSASTAVPVTRTASRRLTAGPSTSKCTCIPGT